MRGDHGSGIAETVSVQPRALRVDDRGVAPGDDGRSARGSSSPITGYAVLSRFAHVHPRAEGAFNTMPAAVLTALAGPAAMQGNWIEWTGPVAPGPVGLRGMVGRFPRRRAATPIVLRQFLV
ncbi:hypothetical protein SAZ10_03175 [Mesorhizobium sp. BAC0120]|uniref:hypothetical protein n=1 Tax=Mesorhizobium sp. BAC0120 TaxID=3090670 RepID=UPI00298BD9F7|nr:hypothetical protein [Mesorhizobium sp. BAC0120]MDW6020758.1 hypothetical protein [Mesorhizobium sp. BAC0120]